MAEKLTRRALHNTILAVLKSHSHCVCGDYAEEGPCALAMDLINSINAAVCVDAEGVSALNRLGRYESGLKDVILSFIGRYGHKPMIYTDRELRACVSFAMGAVKQLEALGLEPESFADIATAAAKPTSH